MSFNLILKINLNQFSDLNNQREVLDTNQREVLDTEVSDLVITIMVLQGKWAFDYFGWLPKVRVTSNLNAINGIMYAKYKHNHQVDY